MTRSAMASCAWCLRRLEILQGSRAREECAAFGGAPETPTRCCVAPPRSETKGRMLEKLLRDRKDAVLERWLGLILASYPADTAAFLQREEDRFLNPVGHTISTEIENIFDELLEGASSDRLSTSLDNIIKIRAVQEFSPSQAVGFVFLLKRSVRDELEAGGREGCSDAELLELEHRIDGVALRAFDKYMERREKIHELRLNEVKARSERLLERMNQIHDRKMRQRKLEEPGNGSPDAQRGGAR